MNCAPSSGTSAKRKKPLFVPKCLVEAESKNKLEYQNTAFSCRFGATKALSRLSALSQPGWASVCCCEKPLVNGPGLPHLVYFLFNMWLIYFLAAPPLVMIEKEHMLHTLHEVAPSPPLSSLPLLSSNVMITISASAVFKSRRSKGTFHFSKWNKSTFRTRTGILCQQYRLQLDCAHQAWQMLH